MVQSFAAAATLVVTPQVQYRHQSKNEDLKCLFSFEIKCKLKLSKLLLCGQFHQHFMLAFLADILAPKNYKAKHFSIVIFDAKISAKNVRVKCW